MKTVFVTHPAYTREEIDLGARRFAGDRVEALVQNPRNGCRPRWIDTRRVFEDRDRARRLVLAARTFRARRGKRLRLAPAEALIVVAEMLP